MGILKEWFEFQQYREDWKEFQEFRSNKISKSDEQIEFEKQQLLETEKQKKDVVLILQHTTNWERQIAGKKVPFTITCNLYENGLGERSFEAFSSLADTQEQIHAILERQESYVKQIHPWLKGAYIKVIPSFQEKKQDILAEMLAK